MCGMGDCETHPRLLRLSLWSPCNFRFRGGGLPTNEHSVPRARQERHVSSSSFITHLSRRCWQASHGQAGNPVDGEPTESGVSNPPLLKLPVYASWRPAVKRDGLGAMAMGAVLGMALGIDIIKVKYVRTRPAATGGRSI